MTWEMTDRDWIVAQAAQPGLARELLARKDDKEYWASVRHTGDLFGIGGELVAQVREDHARIIAAARAIGTLEEDET